MHWRQQIPTLKTGSNRRKSLKHHNGSAADPSGQNRPEHIQSQIQQSSDINSGSCIHTVDAVANSRCSTEWGFWPRGQAPHSCLAGSALHRQPRPMAMAGITTNEPTSRKLLTMATDAGIAMPRDMSTDQVVPFTVQSSDPYTPW